MTNVALFGVGLIVTAIVAGAVSLLILGAVIDGREQDKWRAGRDQGAGPGSDSADVVSLGPVGVRVEPRGDIGPRPMVTPRRRRVPGSTGA